MIKIIIIVIIIIVIIIIVIIIIILIFDIDEQFYKKTHLCPLNGASVTFQ